MSLESNGEFQALLDLDPEEYYGCVHTINENRRIILGERFEKMPIDPQTDAVIVTGSDGKSERHTQSKTEMTLITTKDTDEGGQEIADWFRTKYARDISEQFDVSPTTRLPEVKHVGHSDSPLAFAYNNRDLVYPDRVLNSQLLLGNPEVLHQAKLQVLAEAAGDDEEGKRIRKEIEAQLRIAMKGLESGEYRKRPIFTLDPPEQYYDEDKSNYRVGFKIAGLRPMQRMADLLTIRGIRAGRLSIEEAAAFPTNTVGRIEELSDRGLTPDVQPVIPAYQWFLQQYHVAQDKYKSTRGEVRVPFRQDVFAQHRGALIGFREAMKTFKYPAA